MEPEPRPQRPAGEEPEEGMSSPVSFGIAIAIGVTLLFQFGALMIIARADEDVLGMRMLFGLAQLCLMLLPTYIIARYQPLPRFELLRLRPVSFMYGLLAIAGTLLLWQLLQSYLLLQELYLIPDGWRETYERLQRHLNKGYVELFAWSGAGGLLVSLIIAALIPAVSEELLFRGLTQRSFERMLSPRIAIVLTALLFASLHLEPTTFVPLFSLGVYFGFLASRSGSIVPAVLGHFLVNTVAVFTLYSADGSIPAETPHTVDDLIATLPLSAVALPLFVLLVRRLRRIDRTDRIDPIEPSTPEP